MRRLMGALAWAQPASLLELPARPHTLNRH